MVAPSESGGSRRESEGLKSSRGRQRKRNVHTVVESAHHPYGTSTTSSQAGVGKKKRHDFIQSEALTDSRRQRVLSSATRVYIIPDKLGPTEVDVLRSLVSRQGGMNASLAFANVVLTALRASKRVQRHLDKDALDRHVPVLHTSWLYDSAKQELLQRYEPYKVFPLSRNAKSVFPDSTPSAPPSLASGDELGSERPDSDSRERSPVSNQSGKPLSAEDGYDTFAGDHEKLLLASRGSQETYKDAPVWQNTEYACLRPTPLQSTHNQDLVDALETLRLQRILGEKSVYNATAYGRAISALKSYPHSLAHDPTKAKNIKGVGPKIAKLVVQYYEEGSIAEVDTIRNDDAFKRMTKFMELYGIGPKRARELYSEGARTLDDVIRMGCSIGTHLHIDECLRILPDLEMKIPRVEVEEIAAFIQYTLDSIKSGCVHTVCGGFRRGKSMSSDVDIVISDTTPVDGGKQVTLMEELLDKLKRTAFMTHVINVTNPSNTYEQVFSRLDIAEIVVLPPASVKVPLPRYRRVDIILGPFETHGAAVLGWTGSRQFERDIRLLARHRGYKFHSSGLVPIGESQPVETAREEDIFSKLNIPFMPPALRNCDA